MLLTIALAAFAATLLGGVFALRTKDKYHLIVGFSAGAVIGVAFFDLMPESLALASGSYSSHTVTIIIAIGFLSYLILDRLFLSAGHCSDEGCEDDTHRGRLGAGSLAVHSFLDGLAIGFAFNVSSAVGYIVTIAVLTHDFSDGINTVTMILKGGGSRREAFKWLIVDAIAPVAGVVSTFLFTVREDLLGVILALFCGFFLYIGASELLPESHHSHSTRWTTLSTIAGALLIFVVINLTSL